MQYFYTVILLLLLNRSEYFFHRCKWQSIQGTKLIACKSGADIKEPAACTESSLTHTTLVMSKMSMYVCVYSMCVAGSSPAVSAIISAFRMLSRQCSSDFPPLI